MGTDIKCHVHTAILVYQKCVINEITPVLRPCGLSKPSPNQGICVWHIKFIFDTSAFHNYRALQIKIARHTTANQKTPLQPPLLSETHPALKRMHSQIHNQILRFPMIFMYGTNWFPMSLIFWILVP